MAFDEKRYKPLTDAEYKEKFGIGKEKDKKGEFIDTNSSQRRGDP
jgi:hypothetical protein